MPGHACVSKSQGSKTRARLLNSAVHAGPLSPDWAEPTFFRYAASPLFTAWVEITDYRIKIGVHALWFIRNVL